MGVEGFGDAVGVEGESVAGVELAFVERGVPILEGAHDCGGGFEAMDGIVGAQQKRWKMAAVGVAQAAGDVVELREEQCGERGVGGVFAEELIDGTEQASGIRGQGPLAAQVGLQIGHEQRGSDAFAGNVADDQRETIFTQVQEIVVVATDMAGLVADTGTLQAFREGKDCGNRRA